MQENNPQPMHALQHVRPPQQNTGNTQHQCETEEARESQCGPTHYQIRCVQVDQHDPIPLVGKAD